MAKLKKRTKLDARQFMQVALDLTAYCAQTHARGILFSAATELFGCQYEAFLSTASQVLTMDFPAEVQYMVENAIDDVKGRK